MIRPICRDVLILQRKSVPATLGDITIANDLRDTLLANSANCVGMAANMIGENKNIIVFFDGMLPVVMLNPVIKQKTGPYEAEEGCLSLSGTRKATRYTSITVEYLNLAFCKETKRYTGWTAQIIQHEIDHCNGILI